MWNGGHNPQLENIADIQEIKAYLRDITFGRKFLGCDLDEVETCLTEVSRRYDKIIASLLSRQGPDLQARLEQQAQEIAALKEKNLWFEQANAALWVENAQLSQENMAMCAALAQGGYYC